MCVCYISGKECGGKMEDADGQEVVAEVTGEVTSEVPQEQPLASPVVAVAPAQPAQIDHLFVFVCWNKSAIARYTRNLRVFRIHQAGSL